MKYLSTFACCLLLAACQANLIKKAETFTPIQQASWLEINKRVTIPAGHTRAFFQGGNTIDINLLDLYQVNCELEVQQVAADEQTVEPGRFEITAISQQLSPIVKTTSYRVASAGMLASSTQTDTRRYWQFRLSSMHQPQVRSLICRGIQDTHEQAVLPTVEDISKALGAYMTIHLGLQD